MALICSRDEKALHAGSIGCLCCDGKVYNDACVWVCVYIDQL